jgi:hypothetical protein
MTLEAKEAYRKQQSIERAQRNRDQNKDMSKLLAFHNRLILMIGLQQFNEFKRAWSSLHPRHPKAHVGKEILEFASKNTAQFLEAYVLPEHLNFKEHIGGAEILEELEVHKGGLWQAFEEGIQIDVNDKNLRKFLKGWMASGDRQNPCEDHHTPYSAFDVQSTREKKGFRRCIAQESIEQTLSDYVHLPRQPFFDGNACLLFLSVVTTGGSITNCHIDKCGSGQLLLELYGMKFVVWWELNPEMMKEYAELYHRMKGDFLRIGIERRPGFKWTVLNPGDYIVMKPGTIHGVLSPVNAVVGGMYILHKDWIKDGRVESYMAWQFEQMTAMVENPNQDQLNMGIILSHAEASEIKLWELLRDKTDDDVLKMTIQSLLSETNKRMKWIKGHKGFKANQKMHSKS